MPHEKICDYTTFFFSCLRLEEESEFWGGERVKIKNRSILLPNWNAQTFLRNGHRTQPNELTLTGASTKNAEANPLYLMGSAAALDSRYIPINLKPWNNCIFFFSWFAWRGCSIQSVAWDVQVDQRCADFPIHPGRLCWLQCDHLFRRSLDLCTWHGLYV